MGAKQGIESHPLLCCGLLSIVLTGAWVVFYLPEGQCTDMTGAIALAKQINPEVAFIATIGGNELNTCYGHRDGVWFAFKGWVVAHPSADSRPRAFSPQPRSNP